MRESSSKYDKMEFIERVANTIGLNELATILKITNKKLISKIKGLCLISDSEVECVYQALSQLTTWEKTHV